MRGGHQIALGIPFLKRNASPGGQVGVAGGVDVDAGAQGGEAVFVANDKRLDAAQVIPVDARQDGVKQEVRP
jgi:hypothetical protein